MPSRFPGAAQYKKKKPMYNKGYAQKRVYKRPPIQRSLEMKYSDQGISAGITATSAGTCLSQIAEGSDNNNRIGRKITIRSVQYNLQIAASITDLSGSATENADTIRVVCVWDKQSNGTTPAYVDVYSSTGVSTGAQQPFNLRFLDNIERFQVLGSDLVNINSNGANAVNVQRYIKCNIPVRFTGTAGAVANIITGGIWLFYVDMNTGATYATISGFTRVSFADE